MNILIDTHILLWSLYKTEKLSSRTISLLSNDDNLKYISLASVWEIEIKNSIGKLDYDASEVLKDAEEAGFKVLDIKKKHIFGLHNLERIHNDPFDRLLISQAETEELSFITSDSKIKQYGKDFVIMN